MKIDATNSIYAVERYRAITNKNNIQKAENRAQKDAFEISDNASLFSETLKAARSAMENRLQGNAAQVGEIKREVESGTYSVSSRELADSILMSRSGYFGEITNDD